MYTYASVCIFYKNYSELYEYMLYIVKYNSMFSFQGNKISCFSALKISASAYIFMEALLEFE